MFVGKNCGLCTNSNWDVKSKGHQGLKSQIALAVVAGCAAAVVSAQSSSSPSSSFPRGSSLQNWQNPGMKNVLAKCKNPPAAVQDSHRGQSANANAAPPAPVLPPTAAIPGVLAAGQSWKVVWSWEGNNVDGPIAGDNGTVLFANNDASNVMQIDPSTGLAKILYRDTNTGGAVSRSKNGALFVAERGLGSAIEQLEPQRKMLANSFHGEPLDCVGGVVNDLMADARGGVYFSVTGVTDSGVFYADPKGVVSQYGKDVPLANGIILSPDEKTLYVTNGATVYAFDVKPDGSLTNQREFGKLQGGEGGDGSAVDQQGRVYVATGKSVDVFAPDGKFARQHPGPAGPARHVLRRPRQEDALRHRVLRRMGNAERAKRDHRDSDDRAGLYRASEVNDPIVYRRLLGLPAHVLLEYISRLRCLVSKFFPPGSPPKPLYSEVNDFA